MRQEIAAWVEQCQQWKAAFPVPVQPSSSTAFCSSTRSPRCAEKTRDRKTIITVGVGQHQMWVAQFYKFRYPRTWLSSSGLGTMGFGLPAAMGAQVAHPDALVVDIDGDGSFQMNIQELATCYCENLPVKVLLLNNQHLGMVVQWEDRFMAGNRAHTYLGPIHHAEASGNGTGAYAAERYPDYVAIAKGYGCGAATVSQKADLSDALDEMLASTRPVRARRPGALHGTCAAHDSGRAQRRRHDHGIAGLHRPLGRDTMGDVAAERVIRVVREREGDVMRYAVVSAESRVGGRVRLESVDEPWTIRADEPKTIGSIERLDPVVRSTGARPMPGSKCWRTASNGRKDRCGWRRPRRCCSPTSRAIRSWPGTRSRASGCFASRRGTRARRRSPARSRERTDWPSMPRGGWSCAATATERFDGWKRTAA